MPAIKIIFFDAILGLKDCCVLDYDTFEEVNNTMAIMWEDSNEDYWARAESVAYEIHQWKKINPNEEHKSEQMSREEHEWCLQEKEEKEIEKQKKLDEKNTVFIPGESHKSLARPNANLHGKKKKKKVTGSAAGKSKDTPIKKDKDRKAMNGKEKKKWLDGMGRSTSSLHPNSSLVGKGTKRKVSGELPSYSKTSHGGAAKIKWKRSDL